jgi:hypothetical protein
MCGSRQGRPRPYTTCGLAFVPSGPVMIGLDETIERRRGRKLTARALIVVADRGYAALELSASCARQARPVAGSPACA